MLEAGHAVFSTVFSCQACIAAKVALFFNRYREKACSSWIQMDIPRKQQAKHDTLLSVQSSYWRWHGV
jgi:hypothetical protein